MTEFIHLHNHTYYSLLDGACRIPDLVDTAKKFGMKALAITDHGNMFGVISFYKEAMKAGIKPIIGMEAYIAPRSRTEKSGGKADGETAFHLIILARNMDGYKNLMKLSSIGYLEGFYYKPRIDKEVLQKHSEGLIVLSSCIKGEIPYKLIHDDYQGAIDVASYYKDVFGDNFYLEIQDHGIEEEKKAVKGLLEISKKLGVPVVATNDTHYLKKEHCDAHDVLLCLQTNRDVDDPNRMRFGTNQIYFKSPDEMASLFKERPEVLSTSMEIAEKCHLVLDFDTLHLPSFHIPEKEDAYSLDDFLEKKSYEGIRSRFQTISPEIDHRMKHELSVIKKMGYAGYFLIVMDFIKHAKEEGIPVGPGRGSAAGSLVSYALGITNVDPLKYGLIFERFLNPERVSMPDIDIDFCYERRDEIIDYVKKKYGDKNVTQIITFGSMNARAVIRDVGRVLKIPYDEVDQIAKMIPYQIGITINAALEKVPEFKAKCRENETYKKLIEYSLVLEGLARHASTHAAGVVIAPGELTEYVPLFKSTRKEGVKQKGDSSADITTQYDMKSLVAAGLLKMDFLGLRTLTVIDHTLKILKKNEIHLDIENIPYDDPATYRIFAEGQTVGVFQFESSGMREYLKKLVPESIEDLTAMNALYRPGPMEMIDDFIDRKRGRTPVQYLHPLLEPILKETHGIIVYQEQVIKIASELGGFSMGDADLLRRAMGKKRLDLMQEQRSAFVQGAKNKGIPEDTANSIFDLMDRFAGYGFNKSHATGYSIVAYQTAYLKAHYPKEFMAANLTSEMGNTDRVVILIDECKQMNIEILPPDVNESVYDFNAIEKGIRFGLGAVKNVGKGAIESILEAREKSGKFNTLFDLCKNLNLRLVNKKVLESLIQSGTMDSLEGNRAQKMAVLNKAIQLAQTRQQGEEMGQTSIFESESLKNDFYPELPKMEPWAQGEKLRKEKELLGFYKSGHPLLKFKDEINAFANPVIGEIGAAENGQPVRLCGIITDVKNMFDKKDNPMAFFTIEDFSGNVRAIVFSRIFEKFRSLIQVDKIVAVLGTFDRRDGRDIGSVIVSEIIPVEETREKFTKRLLMNIPALDKENDQIDRVKMVFDQYPGTIPVYMKIRTTDENQVTLKSKKFRINPKRDLIADLRTILGQENVWIEG